jgi:hypothetical protein
MRRFSIRILMAVIVLAAVSLGALRNANDLWAGLMLLVAMAAVCFAVMGAVILRASERVWCAGFVFLGGLYLACVFAPWLSDKFQPIPGTTHILNELFSHISPQTMAGDTMEVINMYALARQAHLANFQRVGHALFAVLAGLLGGTVAAWFYARQERADAADRETHS